MTPQPEPVAGATDGDVAAVHACADLGSAVATMTRLFREAGLDTPGLDARRLAGVALGLDAAVLMREPDRRLDAAANGRLARVTARRLAREPVSRIAGFRAFHGLDFELGAATLDPRPDTEVLVDGVLALVRQGLAPGGQSPHILDLGTGSGAILVALLASLPAATGVGVDISGAAIAVARRNADRLGAGSRASFQQSSWYGAVCGPFDIVVSNPPYIPRSQIASLEPEVSRHDPLGALDGGDDGLDGYRSIIAGVGAVLAPGGWLALEIGMGQAEPLHDLLSAGMNGWQLDGCQWWTDLSGTTRCVAARARDDARGSVALKPSSPR